MPETAFRLPAIVTGILPTGGNWILELQSGDGTLFLTTHEAPEIATGAEVTAWIKPKALHIFDRDGQRMGAADRLMRAPKPQQVPQVEDGAARP